MVNGRAGKGTKIFDRESAERLVEELNREYPQIHHEMVEHGREDVAQTREDGSDEAASQPMELAGAR
jgi:hypothetical protein